MRTRAISLGRQRCIALIAVLVPAAWACGSQPITAPTSPSSIPTPAPGEPAIPFRVFGVVTSAEGAPIADAVVTLSYLPEFMPLQTVSGRTRADGRYEIQLNAQQPGNVSAVVSATSSGDYSPTDLFVRIPDTVAERNFRLRPIRTIAAGQSAAIRFDADSSVCSSLGLGLCEWVRFQAPGSSYGVRVTATGPGGVVPTLFATVGTYRFTGQGVLSLSTGDDEFPIFYSPPFIDIAVSIPYGTAPQQYVVTVLKEGLQ